MGSKHSPPKWWLQGDLEEEWAEDQRRRDAEWVRKTPVFLGEKFFLGEELFLKSERHYIPPATKTIDDFSMGCRVASSPCRICQKDECSHMYQQDPAPLTEQQKIEQDVLLLGVGFGMLQDDGTVKHMPATKMLVYHRDHIQMDVRLPLQSVPIKLEVKI